MQINLIKQQMLIKNSSRSSINSIQRQHIRSSRNDTLQLSQDFENIISEAAKVLSHSQFMPLYEKMIKTLIKRAETENLHSQSIYLNAIRKCLSTYGDSLELNVRILLLQIESEVKSSMLQEVSAKLQRAKHLTISTNIQYLLSKIFLIEEKYYLTLNDESSALKSLKKCLDLNEQHMVQFMQETEEIRKQIVDYAIIAYHQSFKLRSQSKPTQALDFLLKACQTANKSYGQQNKISRGLLEFYKQQENLINSMERMSTKSRAITEIVDYESKRNYHTTAFYSWEDEKIVAQLIKIKGMQREVISEACYEIKLDINKIKQLKNSDWLSVSKTGQVLITEDELLRLLGVNATNTNKEMTTRIQMRNITRDQIIKKDNISSSSEDSSDFFEKEQFKFMKFGRTQSTKKFKDAG